MHKINVERIAKKVMSAQLAGRDTDPRFYSGLAVLPNPDPILRNLGVADDTYAAIANDPHVMGELRSIRAGIIGYELRVVNGVDGDPPLKEKQAQELCELWLSRNPAPRTSWQDVIWHMATAVFHGRQVHEMVWGREGKYVLPIALLDRPNRRFIFDVENHLRLLTRAEPVNGQEIEDYRILLTRHMPSSQNPYGQAVFSSCFWPYTFKHGGFKFFYKFCERFGLPWPVGKYPAGTPMSDQLALLDALVKMTEDGAAVIPEGDAVEIHQASYSGELAQEALVHLCNREISKALTSQTLSTELRQVGSNAASKTHAERQSGVQDSDRQIICATMNEAFRWITLFNFGPGVAAPLFEFYKSKDVTKDRAEIWEIASRIGRPSRKAFHEEMNIPEAADDEDTMIPGVPAAPTPGQRPGEFAARACAHCGSRYDFAGSDNSVLADAAVRAADDAIENHWIAPAYRLLSQFVESGKTLQEFQAALPALYGTLDDAAVIDITDQVLELAAAEGMEVIG